MKISIEEPPPAGAPAGAASKIGKKIFIITIKF
jgi:hypothetical protein